MTNSSGERPERPEGESRGPRREGSHNSDRSGYRRAGGRGDRWDGPQRGPRWARQDDRRDDRPRGDRDRNRDDRGRDDRREDRPRGGRFGDDRPRGERREWNDRPRTDRPRDDRYGNQGRGDDRPRGDRYRSDRFGDDRGRGDRPRDDRFRSDRPRGERREGFERRDDRPRGGRFGDDRPRGERREWNDRPRTDRPRDDRPREDRFRGDDRPRGERREWNDRPRTDRPRSDRPRDDRYRDQRRGDDRPRGGRFGDDRPRGERREWNDRPRTDRPRDDRFRGDDRPRGDRRDGNDRGYRGSRGPERRDERPWRDRDGRPDEHRSDRGPRTDWADRPERRTDRYDRAPRDREFRGRRDDRDGPRGGFRRDGLGRRPDQAPRRHDRDEDRPRRLPIPDDVTGEELDRSVRQELMSLPKTLATDVARNLVMVARLLDEDPERAYGYARTALRLASRVGAVREAAGFAAYGVGRYAEALTEFRAARRMTGSAHLWPIMADCERGIGRPERALAMAGEPEVSRLDKAGQVEMRLVAAGARRDLGQPDAAVVTLQSPELASTAVHPWTARLRYAYADALLAVGREEEAREWFAKALEADQGGTTNASDRLAELDGVEFVDALDPEAEDADLDD